MSKPNNRIPYLREDFPTRKRGKRSKNTFDMESFVQQFALRKIPGSEPAITVAEYVLLCLKKAVAKGNKRTLRRYEELMEKAAPQNKRPVGHVILSEPITTHEDWMKLTGTGPVLELPDPEKPEDLDIP